MGRTHTIRSSSTRPEYFRTVARKKRVLSTLALAFCIILFLKMLSSLFHEWADRAKFTPIIGVATNIEWTGGAEREAYAQKVVMAAIYHDAHNVNTKGTVTSPDLHPDSVDDTADSGKEFTFGNRLRTSSPAYIIVEDVQRLHTDQQQEKTNVSDNAYHGRSDDLPLAPRRKPLESKQLPTWTSTGYMQDGLWRFQNQIEEWKEDVSKSPGKVRYMLYSCTKGCGGFADRQEGIVAAFLLASLTGRQFYIEHDNPCQLTEFYLPNKVDWRLTEKVKQKLQGLSTLRMSAHNTDGFKVGEVMATIDLDTILNKDVVYFAANQDFYRYLTLNPRWQNLTWAQNMTRSSVYAAVWEHLFKLTPSMESSFISFTNNLFKLNGTNGERYTLVCGQFRLKKNPTIPNDNRAHDVLDPEPIWNHLKRYNRSDEYRIFVASDSEEIRREARARFPETFVDVPGSILHIDLAAKTRYLCDSGFKKVILDQLALASCDISMRGYQSHLGAIAAYMRGSDEDLYCYNGTRLTKCSPQDENFHFGPVFKLGMTRHWEVFFSNLNARRREMAQRRETEADKEAKKLFEKTEPPKSR